MTDRGADKGGGSRARRIDVPPGRGCWWIPPDRQGDEAKTALGQAYIKLREQILSGELPPGSPLSEYQLSKSLSVSRTPVRAALARLQAVGLVRSVPQRGMFVRELGPQDVLEIVEIREALESLAVRRLVEQGIPEGLLESWEEETEEARQMIASDQLPEALALGCKLHDEIVNAATNGRLTEILAHLSEQIWLLGMVGIRAPGRPEQANNEHRELLAHLRAGDADAAAACMREHLRNEGRILLQASLPAGSLTLR